MTTTTRVNSTPLILAAFALFLLIYVPVIIGLAGEWYADDNYSHGFLVPVISAFLLYLKRGSISELLDPPGTKITRRRLYVLTIAVFVIAKIFLALQPALIVTLNIAGWFVLIRGLTAEIRAGRFHDVADAGGGQSGVVLILAGMAVFVLANAAAEYFTLRLSMIITLCGLFWYLFGRKFVVFSWFELLFLVFMVPWPYVIYFAATFPMQLFATKVTVAILNMIGMSAIAQGNVIHLPGYSLEVAEACSGLRSLISLLALGAVYARYSQKDLPRQIILFLSTIPIAIAANIFRVTFTAVGAYAVSRELAEDFLHELSGMMVFVVAFIMMFLWGAILKIGSKKK